ncbi:primosomal protein N' [Orrella daihaiensis]|uniref:Replication restart protein PriA n=1 Tax=Orrella daihaiensis TaxID=2782176 RepID=A0ABY4AIW7_9BURK|nr:primosomal protein N' [Orrella daihaiensis]UOD50236.1 primosomal protein N' [Orrella daihaiensis]
MPPVSRVPISEASALRYCRVALDVPLAGPFDYASAEPVEAGDRVLVPFGRRRLIGVVIQIDIEPTLPPEQIRPIERVLRDLGPLLPKWLALAEFAAGYYQRPVGEVMLPALPVPLRRVSSYEGKRAGQQGPVERLKKRRVSQSQPEVGTPLADSLTLTSQQQHAADQIMAASGFAAFLLFGVTGSGKTQVYLTVAQAVLARGGRVLFLVPEINLTPQFAQALLQKLGSVVTHDEVAILHSRLADGERLDAWLRAHEGQARIVLGTRLAIFVSMPAIDLIVVDEEHDPSYKQQEGLRYSARDLAVWRARQENAPVILGSATPSLESWHKAERGDYQRLTLTERASAAALPTVQLIDTRRLELNKGLAPQLIDAIGLALSQARQALVYLNRRGYAPVLHCNSCGWVSQCDHCTAFSVVHRAGGHRMRLHCHHCGAQRVAPASCPSCGDPDLQPMGRGTQRLEEHLAQLFPQARIARIDADSTRRKGSAQDLFEQVHAGEVDILVGTQMVSKGHDFGNLGVVGVVNADAMLFSQDFRAPERLFAQLLQVAGRAGRDGKSGLVMIQTGYPEQPLYQALKRHDYEGFARSLMLEREAAGLPPFAFQALLTAEATQLPDALGFLEAARATALAWLQAHQLNEVVTLYDAVPLRVVRVAKICRAQLLIEASSRAALHRLLRGWLISLGSRHGTGGLRWQLEVDPLEI